MVKLKCLGCGRVIEAPDDYDSDATCKECGELFILADGSKVEPEKENDYECIVCGNDINKEDAVIFEDCDDYEDYDTLVICKHCIDKQYPRDKKVVYKEKIIEKPVIKYIRDSSNKPTEVAKPIENSDFTLGSVF